MGKNRSGGGRRTDRARRYATMAHGITESIRRAAVPIHRAGWPFIAAFAMVTLILFVVSDALGFLGVLLTLWCTLFFRDPPRCTPLSPGLATAPADGRVAIVDRAVPPAELGLDDMPRLRISVFMSVFDVHVNRAPVAGTVSRLEHKPGRFLNAEDPASTTENERVSIALAAAAGEVGVVLIAGLVARRIVPFTGVGAAVAAGERIGMIRFGSRVDVYLPHGAVALVAEGQRAVAGETPIADLAGLRPALEAVRLD